MKTPNLTRVIPQQVKRLDTKAQSYEKDHIQKVTNEWWVSARRSNHPGCGSVQCRCVVAAQGHFDELSNCSLWVSTFPAAAMWIWLGEPPGEQVRPSTAPGIFDYFITFNFQSGHFGTPHFWRLPCRSGLEGLRKSKFTRILRLGIA